MASLDQISGNREDENEDLVTYVIPDFNAVNYIKKDFFHHNEFHIEEESTASGFEIYLVEQWVNERRIGTVLSAYTGNHKLEVRVVKFTIIKKDARLYPPRFREYLNELKVNNAVKKSMETKVSNTQDSSNGRSEVQWLFVTNLSAVPPSLNLISISESDLRATQKTFIINSNLKKLRCSGRSLLLLRRDISDANEDKFRHLYKIENPSVPLDFAIRELVNVIQTCLFYFDLLEARYCDGFLCNKTEEAVLEWWNTIGLRHFKFKPRLKDGILSSQSVSAIISLLLGIRLRLQIVGSSDVPKDPFDFESFMISIGQFQKSYKLEKRRKLDLETFNTLIKVSNSKLMFEKPKASSTYDQFEDFDISDYGDSKTSLQVPGVAERSSLLVSPSKRGKSSYGKEIKKLTKAVKITVQDRIGAANREMDDSNSRFRNTIAKLTDTTNPLDVETTELEVLVKYLTGKTLLRLWYGTSASSHYPGSKSQNKDNMSKTYVPNSHHSNENGQQFQIPVNLSDESIHQKNAYVFQSLKDKITAVQVRYNSTIGETSKYSRGINRVKLGLQNRGLLSNINTNRKKLHLLDQIGSPEDGINTMKGEEKSDMESVSNDIPQDDLGNNVSRSPSRHSMSEQNSDCVGHLVRSLNRRNSFPFNMEREGNLNLLESLRSESDIFDQPFTEATKIKRSPSFSAVEDRISNRNVHSFSCDAFASKYLITLLHIIKVSLIQKKYWQQSIAGDRCSEVVLKSSLKRLDTELARLEKQHGEMLTNNQRVMEEQLGGTLEFHVRDLSAKIDRLLYETRIVVKRINELEENAKLLNSKLQDESVKKLNQMIDTLIHSRKFYKVFKDDKDRNDILIKLTGKNENQLFVNTKTNKTESDRHLFQIIASFLFDMITIVFQLFKFDRSKMNVNRIRKTWAKLDPNRYLIKTAYDYIGREPSKDSVAANVCIDEPAPTESISST